MHHQLSNIHKLIFSAWNTSSGDIFTYSSHFPLKLTEQGCRPARSRQGKSHHMFTAACDNNSLPSVVGLSSHRVLPPTVCDCPEIWPVAPGSALEGVNPSQGSWVGAWLQSSLPRASVQGWWLWLGLGGALSDCFCGERWQQVGASLHCWDCKPATSLKRGQADLQLKPGEAEQLHTSEWVSQGCREVSHPPA